MTARSAQPALPPRMEAAFSGLLRKLIDCDHQAHTLIDQSGLPRWCRRPMFFFLGYIAKAEGRVSEQDISFAENLIKALGLSKRQRNKAISSFQKGKASEALPPLTGVTLRLSHRISPTPALKMAVCLCHAAQLHGRPGKPRRYRCEDTIAHLGMPVSISDDIFDSYASRVWCDISSAPTTPVNLEQACALLGVTRRDPVTTIKRAYRKKVSGCHPDKLAQKQLTSRERALAKEQLLAYQQAWELIRRHR